MNKHILLLYKEHEVIVNVIDSVQMAGELLHPNPDRYKRVVVELIRFFREYADRYHHFKEEEILFPEMGKKSEIVQSGILCEMIDHHVEFRSQLRMIEFQLAEGNLEKANAALRAYSNELLDHIAIENDEVFQMADSLFTAQELEQIECRFLDCDRDLGEDRKEYLREQAEQIRNRLALGGQDEIGC